jgi:hypothetical protein
LRTIAHCLFHLFPGRLHKVLCTTFGGFLGVDNLIFTRTGDTRDSVKGFVLETSIIILDRFVLIFDIDLEILRLFLDVVFSVPCCKKGVIFAFAGLVLDSIIGNFRFALDGLESLSALSWLSRLQLPN